MMAADQRRGRPDDRSAWRRPNGALAGADTTGTTGRLFSRAAFPTAHQRLLLRHWRSTTQTHRRRSRADQWSHISNRTTRPLAYPPDTIEAVNWATMVERRRPANSAGTWEALEPRGGAWHAGQSEDHWGGEGGCQLTSATGTARLQAGDPRWRIRFRAAQTSWHRPMEPDANADVALIANNVSHSGAHLRQAFGRRFAPAVRCWPCCRSPDNRCALIWIPPRQRTPERLRGLDDA